MKAFLEVKEYKQKKPLMLLEKHFGLRFSGLFLPKLSIYDELGLFLGEIRMSCTLCPDVFEIFNENNKMIFEIRYNCLQWSRFIFAPCNYFNK